RSRSSAVRTRARRRPRTSARPAPPVPRRTAATTAIGATTASTTRATTATATAIASRSGPATRTTPTVATEHPGAHRVVDSGSGRANDRAGSAGRKQIRGEGYAGARAGRGAVREEAAQGPRGADVPGRAPGRAAQQAADQRDHRPAALDPRLVPVPLGVRRREGADRGRRRGFRPRGADQLPGRRAGPQRQAADGGLHRPDPLLADDHRADLAVRDARPAQERAQVRDRVLRLRDPAVLPRLRGRLLA